MEKNRGLVRNISLSHFLGQRCMPKIAKVHACMHACICHKHPTQIRSRNLEEPLKQDCEHKHHSEAPGTLLCDVVPESIHSMTL